MQWAYIAIWFGWFGLIQSQVVPGSYLGFPNCTNSCDSIILNPDSGCDIFAVNQTRTGFLICICQHTSLFQSIVNCVAPVCTPSEVEASFQIVAGACNNIGLTLATPSVSGFTLTASFLLSTATPSFASITSTPPGTVTAASEVSVTRSAISHSSKGATTTFSLNMTATSSSNLTAFAGAANRVMANKILAGFGLGLYYALC